jgi:hypothetical protein
LDDNADIKKLESKAYAALKEYFEAVVALETFDTQDVSFFVNAFCMEDEKLRITGQMITPIGPYLLDRKEVAINELICAGWPTVAAGISSANMRTFNSVIAEQVQKLQEKTYGAGHA